MDSTKSILLASFFSLLVFAEASHACSCVPLSSTKDSFDSAEAVFLGQVWGVRYVNKGIEATLVVGRSWKGVDTQKVRVLTGSGTCEIRFALDEWYLLYADKIDGHLSISSCSRHQLLPDGFSGGALPTDGNFENLGKGKDWKYDEVEFDE